MASRCPVAGIPLPPIRLSLWVFITPLSERFMETGSGKRKSEGYREIRKSVDAPVHRILASTEVGSSDSVRPPAKPKPKQS